MRVAFFVNCYPAPSHAFVRREVRELESQGVEVLRFSVRHFSGELVDEGDREEALQTRYIFDSGVIGILRALLHVVLFRPMTFFRVMALSVRMGWRADRGIPFHIAYLCEACVLLWWCRKLGVQHVHSHFGTNSTMVPMLCRLLGGPPYSFTVHGPDEFDRPVAIALGEKIRHARFVVAITSFCRSQLFRWCPYDQWQKIKVVRSGMDDAFLGNPLTPVPDTKRLVCVGRLCEQKGQMLLVEAAQTLRGRGIEFQILLIGDGDMRPAVERRISEVGLDGEIQLMGWASSNQVRDCLLEARALVLPSFAEGLPGVIQEAFALGRPVVTTWITGIPELVEQGKTGWLVPAGDVHALADAIQEVLETPVETLNDMGARAAKEVRRLHDIHIEMGKLARLFSDSENSRGACP